MTVIHRVPTTLAAARDETTSRWRLFDCYVYPNFNPGVRTARARIRIGMLRVLQVCADSVMFMGLHVAGDQRDARGRHDE